MISYNLSEEEKTYAWSMVNLNKIANRGNESDGSKEHQFTGVLGEIVFCDNNAIPRPLYDKGFDHGIDIVIEGVNVDIKTMGRDYDFKEGWVNNLMASQVEGNNYETDVYLFANINKKKSTIQYIGWISKQNVLERASGICRYTKGDLRTRDDGSTFFARADMYEIPFNALTTFKTMQELKLQIQGYKIFYKDNQK